jgi:ubiquinone/menaquinone biosynthesis C-methylase UbiE
MARWSDEQKWRPGLLFDASNEGRVELAGPRVWEEYQPTEVGSPWGQSVVKPNRGADAYVLGHSDRELERLRRQAQLIDPITRQFLIEAGIGSGMRVLDVGSGAGDVAFLAANLVGRAGQVVGVDRSAAALSRARTRAEEQSLVNVTFRESELLAIAFDQRFDAAIGRYVLCFQPDPVSLVRCIANLVRPGGIILFHEPDREQTLSIPPVPTYDRAYQWVSETYRQSGMDVRMGAKLYSTFCAAGLAAPTMRMHSLIGGANARDEVHLDADQARVLASEIERLGIATASELDIETLVERITKEMAANQSIIVGRAEIGAWSRV